MIEFVRQHDGRRLSMSGLQYFTERMFISPRVVQGVKGPGRGRPCTILYGAADLVLVRWMLRLKEQGIPLKKFAGALRTLRRLLPRALEEPGALKFFVLDQTREIGVSLDGSAFQLTGDVGQVLLAFSMDMAKQTVEQLERVELAGAAVP